MERWGLLVRTEQIWSTRLSVGHRPFFQPRLGELGQTHPLCKVAKEPHRAQAASYCVRSGEGRPGAAIASVSG